MRLTRVLCLLGSMLCFAAPHEHVSAQSTQQRPAGSGAAPAHRGGAASDAARKRWSSLTEAQRDRLRKAYRTLSKLPKSERARILERYRHFRSRSPAQRQALREQYQAFRRLPPNERRAIRQSFERYRKLSQAQRERLRQSLRELGKMGPAERRRFLSKLERWRELSHGQREKVRARLKRRLRR